MAAKDDDKKVLELHTKLMFELNKTLTKKNLKKLKSALVWSHEVPANDCEDDDDWLHLCGILMQNGQIGVGKYEFLIKHLDMAEVQDCIRVIEDFTSKIDEYRKRMNSGSPHHDSTSDKVPVQPSSDVDKQDEIVLM